MRNEDAIGLDGCIVRDENYTALAVLEVVDDVVFVKKTTACSIGTHLYIICRLRDLGYYAV